jgi:hypothetical protein
MSKSIEFSDSDYARIQHSADTDGMSLDAWIVSHLPLENGAGEPAKDLLGADGQPAKTMYDLLAGRIGRFSSGTGQPSSSEVRESFAEYLEEKHRKGHL